MKRRRDGYILDSQADIRKRREFLATEPSGGPFDEGLRPHI